MLCWQLEKALQEKAIQERAWACCEFVCVLWRSKLYMKKALVADVWGLPMWLIWDVGPLRSHFCSLRCVLRVGGSPDTWLLYAFLRIPGNHTEDPILGDRLLIFLDSSTQFKNTVQWIRSQIERISRDSIICATVQCSYNITQWFLFLLKVRCVVLIVLALLNHSL